MSEEKDSPGGLASILADGDPQPLEAQEGGPGSHQPMHMQLFSTWEVRKAPVNCVPRLCTLQVTRLEVARPLEAGLGSLVLAASMKTPHRFLRSNEIILPPSGVITVPLELTFSLQYPHFLKRGGNVLQIRLQRRKRVRNRPLGGYKNLAIGLVEMSQVLQHSFQGEVKLYSEKVTEHMAVVTVGSLSSTAVDLERREHLVEASSDDDDEDIFSDDHTDSESGDNEHHSDEAKKKSKPSTSAVLRLLHLYRPSKTRRRHPDAMMLEEEEGEVFHGSSVAFASSPSDSEEDEEEGEELVGATPTRPTLSPFFGSDRCSMVSLPTTAKSAEKLSRGGSEESPLGRGTPESSLQIMGTPPLKYGSLERAVLKDRLQLPALPSSAAQTPSSWDLTRGRLWCVADSLPSSSVVVRGLEKAGEVVVTCTPKEIQDVQLLLEVVNFVFKHWVSLVPFCIALVGDDSLVSCSLQALSQSRCPPEKLRFAIIPIVPGLMSTRLSSIDDKYEVAFPSDGQWLSSLPDSTDPLLHYVEEAISSLPLPMAKVVLRRPATEPSSGGTPFMFSEQSLPFMCNVSIGSWDMEPADASPVPLPTSPVYGNTAVGGTVGGATETPELVLEYWNPKGQKEKPSSVKVRSVLVSYVDNILNVTATKEKKNKGIRIRKPKDSDTAWGSIVSLTTTQLLCRPVSKGESMAVMVDGVEREGLSVVRLQANWDLTPNTTFSIAVTADVAST